MKIPYCFYILSTLVLVVSACGSDNGNGEKSIEDFILASGEVSGWDEANVGKCEAGIQVTSEIEMATLFINGAIDYIERAGDWEAVALECYQNGDDRIKLFIVEMSSVQGAKDAYDEMGDYWGLSWEDYDYGGGEDYGRFACVWKDCYANATKGEYFVEVSVNPETSEASAKDVCTAVLNKIP